MYLKWSQSNWAKAFLLLIAGHSVAFAHLPKKKIAKGKEAKFPKLLTQIEAQYAKANTLSADFTQENVNATFSQTKKSSGKIYVKNPLKIRWETSEPNPSVLISNGKTYWYYTPPFEKGERGQVIEKKSSAVQSELAQALLSGNFSVVNGMKIEQKSPSSFKLIPLPKTAGSVVQATIEINPKSKLIEKVTLNHDQGNKSEISLSHIQLGEDLSDEFFQFKIPPDTDRVDGSS